MAYVPGCINMSFSIRLFIFFKKEKARDLEVAEERKGLIYKLIRYPIIQIITIVPATINRIYGAITGNNSVVLGDISLFFECFQGIFIIITFWLNGGSMAYFTQCCRKKESESEDENKRDSFISDRNGMSLVKINEFH